MELKKYQERAVKNLLTKSLDLLERQGKTLLFKAPTGSGKTIMMAEFLARLVDNLNGKDGLTLSFIWFAPRSLHRQSCEKLQKYYRDYHEMVCRYCESLPKDEIGQNEIWFFNWESIRLQDRNTIVRENERGLDIGNVLKNTRKNPGREVILLIDESHYHAKSKISQHFIDDVAPKVIIEITATPDERRNRRYISEITEVELDDVKCEGMIRESVILNDAVGNSPNQKNRTITFTDSIDKDLLNRALDKRQELAVAYKSEGSKINPLLCIQLPDNITLQDSEVRELVEDVLYENNITKENGKLAVWLAEEDENRHKLSDNDSKVEVLIFKQAIALGWDCPRAQILVLFRKWSGNTFSVQTLGRIMRMPEQKHYDNNALNRAYVYTNMKEARIDKELADGYVHAYDALRIEGYENLALRSASRNHRLGISRLPEDFTSIFFAEAKRDRLEENVDRSSKTVSELLIGETEVRDVDDLATNKVKAAARATLKHESDLQKFLDSFVQEILSPTFSDDISLGIVKEALYAFFDKAWGMHYGDEFSEIASIILDKKNSGHFEKVISMAKAKCAPQEQDVEFKTIDAWEVQESATYGDNYIKQTEVKKSVIMPFYAGCISDPEEKFIEELEMANKVKWWYKNGDQGAVYFAVPYKEDGAYKLFYVDFIVNFADGTIGLYDTKEGITLSTASNKSDGLLRYIAEENKKRKRGNLLPLTGGIVTQSETGRWMRYTGEGKKISGKHSDEWEVLELI